MPGWWQFFSSPKSPLKRQTQGQRLTSLRIGFSCKKALSWFAPVVCVICSCLFDYWPIHVCSTYVCIYVNIGLSTPILSHPVYFHTTVCVHRVFHGPPALPDNDMYVCNKTNSVVYRGKQTQKKQIYQLTIQLNHTARAVTRTTAYSLCKKITDCHASFVWAHSPRVHENMYDRQESLKSRHALSVLTTAPSLSQRH